MSSVPIRDFLDGESEIELVYSHDGVKGEVHRVTVKESEVGGGGGKKDRGRKKDKDKDGSGGKDGKDKKGKGRSRAAVEGVTPKGILWSAVPLPSYFVVMKFQRVADQRPQ